MASAEQRKSNGENKVKLADIAKQTGYSLACAKSVTVFCCKGSAW